jgi:ribosomal protein L11 methyltransferase
MKHNNSEENNIHKFVAPYEDLYIYYIQGHLDPLIPIENASFIGNWEEDEFTFLFFSKPSEAFVEMIIAKQPHMHLLDQFHMTYEQWHGGAVEALSVGNFVIYAPWDTARTKDYGKDVHRILLDPGVVFGTGTHATTNDCLTAMEIAFHEEVPEYCVDIGTGTGILALAAASLGCPKILAVDLNLLSVQTAKRNIILNGFENNILAVQGAAEKFVDYPVDLMIANIHYDIMKNLITDDTFYRKKRFILSGLLRSEAAAIKDCLLQNGAKIWQTWDQSGIWFTYYGTTS